MKKDTNLINVHSSAIHIENKVGLKARLAWFYMLYKAFPVLNSQAYFTITIGELKKAIGYTSQNNMSLKDSLTELARTEIQWNIFGKDGHEWGISHLLSECRIKTDSNIIYYEYSSFVKEKLSNPEMYVKINLLVSKTFKSKHSLSMYCLALDYLYIKNNYGEKNISIEDIRKYLGLESYEYLKTGDLYIYVLKKAESEINKNSDLNFKVEAIRGERNKILGFKFQMSIKDEFLDTYKSKQVIAKEQKSTEKIILVSEIDTEIEKIRITNDLLKGFIAENNISMSTKTIQEKLRIIKQSFSDKFEDYLIFLMNYTKEEMKKTTIKNVSGFFVSLIKDEDQLQNYIMYFQEKEIEKQKRQSKLNTLLELELNGSYNSFLDRDFIDFLVNNADKLEKEIVHILKSNLKKGDFFYDVVLPKHNNIIDKTLLTDKEKGTRYFVTHYLSNYKKELNYIPWTFEKWKKNKVTERELKSLEAKLERNIR